MHCFAPPYLGHEDKPVLLCRTQPNGCARLVNPVSTPWAIQHNGVACVMDQRVQLRHRREGRHYCRRVGDVMGTEVNNSLVLLLVQTLPFSSSFPGWQDTSGRSTGHVRDNETCAHVCVMTFYPYTVNSPAIFQKVFLQLSLLQATGDRVLELGAGTK